MRFLMVWALLWVGCNANALEMYADGAFHPAVVQGYEIAPGDTLGGYALYRPEPSRVVETGQGQAVGGDFPRAMPWVAQVYIQRGRVVVFQQTVIADGRSITQGWRGDPCGGNAVVKINQVRGMLDRCAVAQFVTQKLEGKDVQLLGVRFVETNAGGRYYGIEFLVNLPQLGISPEEVSDPAQELHQQMQAWMRAMLDAVIVAAGYDKPAQAFDGQRSVTDVFFPR